MILVVCRYENRRGSSVEVFRVIVRAEEVFWIEFDDVDLLSENFSEIGSFCRLIQKELEEGLVEC